MNTHPLNMISSTSKRVIGTFMRQTAVQSRHLQWKDFQKNKPYAHRFCACASFFDYHPKSNSKKCHRQVYGNFVWKLQVRYDNIRILHGYEGRIENSVPRVTVWHHEALPSDAVIPKDGISYPHRTLRFESFSCIPFDFECFILKLAFITTHNDVGIGNF